MNPIKIAPAEICTFCGQRPVDTVVPFQTLSEGQLEERTCTPCYEAREASARKLGEEEAMRWIAYGQRLFKSSERQAKELRYWFEYAGAFPASAPYSRAILAMEINRLEAL